MDTIGDRRERLSDKQNRLSAALPSDFVYRRAPYGLLIDSSSDFAFNDFGFAECDAVTLPRSRQPTSLISALAVHLLR